MLELEAVELEARQLTIVDVGEVGDQREHLLLVLDSRTSELVRNLVHRRRAVENHEWNSRAGTSHRLEEVLLEATEPRGRAARRE